MNKKAYVKPDAMLVDFSLSSSIAATCTFIGNHASADACSYSDNGWNVYSNENASCVIKTDKEFCYHVPVADTSIFGS